MASSSYLLFSLHGVCYAVDARRVREIFWLPELTPVEEAPPYIAGIVNLRGKIEPVMNLDVRFGHTPRRYQLTDSVILLEIEGLSSGIIVNEVHDVIDIPSAAIEPPPHYEDDTAGHAHFIMGEAKAGDEIVMLLDTGSLIHAPVLSAAPAPAAEPAEFCPQATPAEREIFLSRARNRMLSAQAPDSAAQTPFAVVGLGGEYFGIGLDMVREFSRLRQITPVPCCPPHIAGNMNLRGDILTLVDISPALKIPLQGTAAQVVVAQADSLRVGVPVAEVFDVIYLHPADIAPAPAASDKVNDEYCKGVAHYGEKMVSIIDLHKILTQGGLEVVEEA
ncbi:MAG: chemotaxis protein CheW [Sulfuricella sp.]|nr:chemotaxis protein CheW [Sulfuricella sp.]